MRYDQCYCHCRVPTILARPRGPRTAYPTVRPPATVIGMGPGSAVHPTYQRLARIRVPPGQ
eukprot:3956606-Pleurochrysis_carterae.AAC.1